MGGGVWFHVEGQGEVDFAFDLGRFGFGVVETLNINVRNWPKKERQGDEREEEERWREKPRGGGRERQKETTGLPSSAYTI